MQHYFFQIKFNITIDTNNSIFHTLVYSLISSTLENLHNHAILNASIYFVDNLNSNIYISVDDDINKEDVLQLIKISIIRVNKEKIRIKIIEVNNLHLNLFNNESGISLYTSVFNRGIISLKNNITDYVFEGISDCEICIQTILNKYKDLKNKNKTFECFCNFNKFCINCSINRFLKN